MGSSRENSPDWLRSFKAPSQSVVALSSSSDSSPTNSPVRNKHAHHGQPSAGFASKLQETDRNLEDESVDLSGESPMSNVRKSKPSKTTKDRENDDLEEGDGLEGEAADEELLEKPTEPQVSSRLPLVFHEKIQRLKALVECDGDSIDLSGDMGAVGRISFSNAPSGNSDVLFDLKGTIYKTTIVPCRTLCVVSFGQTEAKIEAVMETERWNRGNDETYTEAGSHPGSLSIPNLGRRFADQWMWITSGSPLSCGRRTLEGNRPRKYRSGDGKPDYCEQGGSPAEAYERPRRSHRPTPTFVASFSCINSLTGCN